MEPTAIPMTEVSSIISAAQTGLTGLGILPYVFAGAVIGLIGRFIIAARKAAR